MNKYTKIYILVYQIDHLVYKDFNLLIDVTGMANMYTCSKGERVYL